MDENKEIFEIFAGTYEEYLLGFKLVQNDGGEFKLEHAVADHSHKGSLRAISCRGYLLATGGFDEIIHVYNLDNNREIGTLTQHTGTVTCLSFTSDEKHLISCSEDGSIAIYRVGSWIMEKLWPKAHKNTYVNWIAVHPSNKLALSVGNDGNIRTWNLITGDQAFTTNVQHLTKRPEFVIWSDNGDHYGLPHENDFSVFTVSTASVKQTFKLKIKITSAQFLQDNLLCIGDMSGNLHVYNVETGKEEFQIQVNESRIKAMVKHKQYLVVATSQGLIVVYELVNKKLREVAKSDCSCRVTCITIACHCCRRERKQKNKTIKTNGEVKVETIEEVKSTIEKKRKLNQTPLNTKRRSIASEVLCSPKRQSWIVQEQD